MKKWYKLLSAVFMAVILLIMPLLTTAGSPPVKSLSSQSTVKWKIKKPFEQKAFIENKGQYTLPGKASSKDIYYGAAQGGLNYYFTANRIWIKREEKVKRTEKEMEALERNDKNKTEDEDENKYKLVSEFHEMNFIGANPLAQLVADSEVSWYYNVPATTNNSSVRAQAWKKLLYKEIYPGIDMEFFFPKDTSGFKYVFIVHPGADPSQIKIQYPLDKSVKLTSAGNVSLQSTYGEFIDHAPVATQEETPAAIDCRFTIGQPSIVGFSMGDYDKTKTLVIDPWTVSPIFVYQDNLADELDWDNAGNCYIYGGPDPFEVSKYNSNGNLLWTINYTNIINCWGAWGAFTVDKQSQSVYVTTTGNCPASEVYKFNSSGALVKGDTPNINNDEFWRINYSASANLLVIAGSGTGAPLGELYTLDTNLVTFTQVDVLNLGSGGTQDIAFQDIWGIALDNFGNCYAAISSSSSAIIKYTGNLMVKCPLPSLSPTLWKVSEGYNFSEGGVNYAFTNGYSGMICSCSSLFTYDAHRLKKWDLDTGSLLANVEVMDSSIIVYDTYDFLWGGLASDNYGNLFVGANDSVKQYNSDLQLTNTIDPGSDGNAIYDVGLNLIDGKTLYVCGLNFVSSITVNPPIPVIKGKAKVEVSQPISCVNPYGSATVDSPSVAVPSDIVWNTNPEQYGKTAINLSTGTYIVGINEGVCEGVLYDTVTINKTGGELVDTVTTCDGHSVTLTGTAQENNYIWSPSTGLSSTSGSSVVVASPTSNTTYTVISTLNNCADTDQINLLINPDPVVSVIPLSASICDGQGVNTFTASGASSYQWSPSNGLNETTGNQVTANPSVTTTYTITGINTTTGCSTTENFDVYVGNQPDASFSATAPVSCEPQIVQFANTSTGGSSYLWNFGDDSTSTEMSPAHTYSKAGNYKVTLVVASVPGCTDSTSLTESIQLGTDNVYVPTAFTPGKESNNYFSPNVVCTDASGYTFRVYNRWGELVYESSSPYQQGWDGKYNGVNQPQDTYVYYIELSCSGCKTLQKGDVTLLR